MSPTSNEYGRIQSRLAAKLLNSLPQGEVITECSINTSDGVKVADVAWLSQAFIDEYAFTTPYPKAPEICIEIVSPSNSELEIQEKTDLYLSRGAHEVWIVDALDHIRIFTHTGLINSSSYL